MYVCTSKQDCQVRLREDRSAIRDHHKDEDG